LAAAADYVQTHSAVPAASAQTPKEIVVTLTGCLKPWDDMAGAPAPTPATTAASGGRRFLLVNVRPEDPGEAALDKGPATQYVVTADATVDLEAQVNRQVRITGRTSAAPTAADAGREPAADAAPKTRWAQLHATSIAMVSATCPTPAD
jgi:hypothetical protein